MDVLKNKFPQTSFKGHKQRKFKNGYVYTLVICLLFMAITTWMNADFEETTMGVLRMGRRFSHEIVDSAVSAACGVANTSMFQPISADCNIYNYVQEITLQCPETEAKSVCHSKFQEGLPVPVDIFPTIKKSEPIPRFHTPKMTSAFLELLEKTHQIFKKHNITYVFMRGTLLGAERHHGFIPWDDDIDILVEPGAHDYILTIPQDFKDAGLSIVKATHMSIIKVWKSDSPLIPKYKWGYPILDVLDFFECEPAGWGVLKKGKCHPIDTIMPPRLAYFEGFSFWVPGFPDVVTETTFKNFDNNCVRKTFSHKSRTKVGRLAFDCENLRSHYHFVTNRETELPFQISSSDLLDILINRLFHHGVEFDISDNRDNQITPLIRTSTLSLAGSTIHYAIDIEFEVSDSVKYGFVVLLTGGKLLPLHYESDDRLLSLELEILAGYEVKSGVHRELMRRGFELSSYTQKLQCRWIFHIVWNTVAILALIF